MTPNEMARKELEYYQNLPPDHMQQYALPIPGGSGFIGMHTIQWWTGM
jgi:hypothetical protein